MKRRESIVYNTYFQITKKASNKFDVKDLFWRKDIGSFTSLAEAKKVCIK